MRFLSQPFGASFGAELQSRIAECDLVHLHCPFPNAEMRGDYFAAKPLVVTWCADPANTRWKLLFSLFRPALLRVLERAKKILLIGPNLFEHSPTLQPFREKCFVIPLAYSKREGPQSLARPPLGSRPNLLFVGKLRRYKGVEFLIRAVADAPEVLLRVIGNGEEMENLIRLTNKLGIASRVTFLSNVSNEDLVEEYKRADIFVLPSVDASEAFGIVQAEAMSYGLPVINTILPSSVPFVSLDGVSGITVPPSDHRVIASAISRLCNDAGFYESCSRNALQRAELFNQETMIQSYAKVYTECGA